MLTAGAFFNSSADVFGAEWRRSAGTLALGTVRAVMSFGGFLGMGQEEHTIPWNKLTYDTNLGGYRTDITEEQLRGAPAFSRDRDYAWTDRAREQELHDYYGARYYWGGS